MKTKRGIPYTKNGTLAQRQWIQQQIATHEAWKQLVRRTPGQPVRRGTRYSLTPSQRIYIEAKAWLRQQENRKAAVLFVAKHIVHYVKASNGHAMKTDMQYEAYNARAAMRVTYGNVKFQIERNGSLAEMIKPLADQLAAITGWPQEDAFNRLLALIGGEDINQPAPDMF